jgi:hypothetical protein
MGDIIETLAGIGFTVFLILIVLALTGVVDFAPNEEPVRGNPPPAGYEDFQYPECEGWEVARGGC